VNSVSLYVLDSGGSLSTEAAKKAIHDSIALCRRDLLRLVLMEDSVVPRPCKELFWKMCKINHLFYSQTDGYSSPEEMISTVNAVIYEPLKLQISDPSLLLNRISKDFVNDHALSSEEKIKRDLV
jgi:ent-kaurene synthase